MPPCTPLISVSHLHFRQGLGRQLQRRVQCLHRGAVHTQQQGQGGGRRIWHCGHDHGRSQGGPPPLPQPVHGGDAETVVAPGRQDLRQGAGEAGGPRDEVGVEDADGHVMRGATLVHGQRRARAVSHLQAGQVRGCRAAHGCQQTPPHLGGAQGGGSRPEGGYVAEVRGGRVPPLPRLHRHLQHVPRHGQSQPAAQGRQVAGRHARGWPLTRLHV